MTDDRDPADFPVGLADAAGQPEPVAGVTPPPAPDAAEHQEPPADPGHAPDPE